MYLRCGIDRGGDDAFEAAADLGFERFDQSVSGFTDGDDQHAGVGVEVVEVVTDSQDAALAVNVAGEGFWDAGFGEGIVENGSDSVAQGAIGIVHGHAGVRVSGMRCVSSDEARGNKGKGQWQLVIRCRCEASYNRGCKRVAEAVMLVRASAVFPRLPVVGLPSFRKR